MDKGPAPLHQVLRPKSHYSHGNLEDGPEFLVTA